MAATEAASFLQAFEIERVATLALNDSIWGMRAYLTMHDAPYVALAQHLDVPLLTWDRRMAKAARRYCQTISHRLRSSRMPRRCLRACARHLCSLTNASRGAGWSACALPLTARRAQVIVVLWGARALLIHRV